MPMEQFMKLYFRFGKPYLKITDQVILSALVDWSQSPYCYKNDEDYFEATVKLLHDTYGIDFDWRTIKESYNKLKKYGYIDWFENNEDYAKTRFGRPTYWVKIDKTKCNPIFNTDSNTNDSSTNITIDKTIDSTTDKNVNNHTSDIILYTSDINIDKKQKPEKHKYGKFNNVLLTDEEYRKLQEEFPDYLQKIDNLSYYLGSTGKSYKSHYMTILNWARKDKANSRQPLFSPTFPNSQKPVEVVKKYI